ncbi:uncharacterized protein [Chelonus insularis]|uniref:uncharacterized protein n=1 Tax=Chelonus insularis TaxID=460826 RepID=UPI00158E5611|nr:uncharacterized protein LOC118070251 [Chelonus insularis]
MTRKCVLCKETNYKNSYSFFSAPKDAETRKKWQEAIGIENYVVNDETFVCSRHFTPGDIITHWVSGVPPHVVTIKYKKCRLRPGAVPSVHCDVPMQTKSDEELPVFELNRNWEAEGKLASYIDANNEQVFIIPRGELITYSHVDNHKCKQENTELVYIAETIDGVTESVEGQEEMLVLTDNSEQALTTLQVENAYTVDENDSTIYLKATNDPQIVYVEDINYGAEESREPDETNDNKESNENEIIENHEVNEINEMNETNDNNTQESFEPPKDDAAPMSDAESIEALSWESMDTDDKLSTSESYERISRHEDDVDLPADEPDEPMEEVDEGPAMLFEDLLDIYTEVSLPRGWSSMVIPAGRATTVIYARMNMTQTGVPYVLKQVFLKSDMNLQCSAAGNSLHPREHKLIPKGKSLVVKSLRDVEEFIEEFDQKVVCDGLEKMSSSEMDSKVIYRQDFKWRHVDCPIIVQNGAARCTKCNTLNFHAARRKAKKSIQPDESAALLKKERTIYVLQKMVSKLTKQNQKINAIKDDPQSLATLVETMEIPEIQKLMIKECLTNAEENAETDFSQTWIFLSLLIYIESPRMYKFLLDNQYMCLPDIQLIRRYLHHIKIDAQFYKLFQRTVEPFQHQNVPEEEKEVS